VREQVSYRYGSNANALFPFGYSLSYTNFSYSQLGARNRSTF
jgi:hypothetical protein